MGHIQMIVRFRKENGVLTEVGTPSVMNKMNITFLSTISFSYLPSER